MGNIPHAAARHLCPAEAGGSHQHLGDEGVDATDKVVTVSLTQADTLLLGSLSPDEDQQVEVQIRGRTEDGRAFASNIMTAPLSRILKDGVI